MVEVDRSMFCISRTYSSIRASLFSAAFPVNKTFDDEKSERRTYASRNTAGWRGSHGISDSEVSPVVQVPPHLRKGNPSRTRTQTCQRMNSHGDAAVPSAT